VFRSTAFFAFAAFPMSLLAAECSCPAVKLEDQFAQAQYVFQGRYVEAQVDKDLPKAYIFQILDTFKGIPEDAEFIAEDAEAGKACALQLELGKSYLVYTRWEWGQQVTSRCLGTKPIAEAESDREVIGPGDAWKAKYYARIRMTCMGKYTTTCCLGSVKAMEEGRYMPVLDDGTCPDGQRPNKLRCVDSVTWCEPFR